MRRIRLLLPGLAFLFLVSCQSWNQDPAITTRELEKHVYFLASDALQGRYPGTEGDREAAAYIRKEFQAAGLQLPAEEGYDPFDISIARHPGDNNSLQAGELVASPGEDFIPALFSASQSLEADAVFAGYGFDLSAGGIVWDDYSGIDPAGKWVILLSGSPDPDNPASGYESQADDRDKVILARDRGAAGVLIIPAEGESFPEGDNRQSSAGIPVFYISRTLADQILVPANDSVSILQSKLDTGKKPQSFDLDLKVKGTASVVEETASTRNVLGLLEGSDPARRGEVLVIGAHYDHLGLGGEGSNSRRPDTIAVHYGADDNASGVAGVIELAEKLSSQRDSIPFSILFVAFGAEEKGLLGSKHLMEQGVIGGDHYLGMINLDMIGRMNEEKVLQVGGTGTAAESDSLLDAVSNGLPFTLARSAEGYGPSDHASFYSKDIPVFFLSTGPHLDYHTPGDTPDKINYEGMKEIADFVDDLVLAIGHMDHPLHFEEAGPKGPSATGRRRGGISFGIMPDFAGVVKDGLRADFVIEGRPAALAGMKDGDVIVAINGKSVKNIDDYMYRLSQLKPGQTVNVEVKREDRSLILLIQL